MALFHRQLAQARSGNKAALGSAFEQFRSELEEAAAYLVGENLRTKASAADVVQDTFLEACKRFDQFRGTTDRELSHWLHQILAHNIVDLSRRYRHTEKRRLRREVSLDASSAVNKTGLDPMDASPPPPDQLMQRERVDEVQKAVERLPDEYRQVIHLHLDRELPFRKTGAMMKRSEDAARKLWARALRRVKQQVESQKPEGGWAIAGDATSARRE